MCFRLGIVSKKIVWINFYSVNYKTANNSTKYIYNNIVCVFLPRDVLSIIHISPTTIRHMGEYIKFFRIKLKF